MSVAPAGRTLTVLVLAAGQGKRLRSKTIKLLHDVAGQPMVRHVAQAARRIGAARVVAVVGHQADDVKQALEGACDAFVLQREQRGTGHAVLQAARHVGTGTALIVNGDVPALRPETLRALLRRHAGAKAALSLLSVELADPTGYGRIVRDGKNGRIARIVEERDATAAERALREVNCGVYCADAKRLLAVLRGLKPDNAQGEYYLTDAVRALLGRGERVEAVLHDDAAELAGVNTRAELAEAARLLHARAAERAQEQGVTLLDAARTRIDPRAKIGRDSVIWPDVVIEGASVLGEDCVVRPGCRLTNVRLGSGVEVRDHSVLADSTVADGATIGPFAHVRPGSEIGPRARVGNFVELKQTRLARGAKANHLTYLGDAEIGAETNVGAGTITCNYDGVRKHRTTMGRRVFIGSNTQIVAPVTIHDGAYVAAGSTVTEDVPAGALAIARSRQRNLLGWVARQPPPPEGRKPRKRR